MKIIVAGHVALDIIPEWNKGGIESIAPGQLLEMDGIEFATGGAVSNTGSALNRLGVDTKLLGKISSDTLGSIIREKLEEENEGITDKMIISEGETSSYTIVLNPPDTDRVFLHFPGTNDTFTSEDISYDELTEADLFHFGYPPLMKNFYKSSDEMVKVFKNVKEKGVVTSLDMAMPDPNSPAGKIDWKKYLQEVLPYVDIFLPSIDELLYMLEVSEGEELMNDDGTVNVNLLEKFGEELLNYGALIVVIKLGDKGLYLQTADFKRITETEENSLMRIITADQWGSKNLLSPCFEVEVVGTTGSGDSTIAGFLAELIDGGSPEETVTAATAVGACSVRVMDASSGIIPLNDVRAKLEKGWDREPVKISNDGWIYDSGTGLWEKEKNNYK